MCCSQVPTNLNSLFFLSYCKGFPGPSWRGGCEPTSVSTRLVPRASREDPGTRSATPTAASPSGRSSRTLSLHRRGECRGHLHVSLGPRPKPTPAWIASSITRVILDAIRAGVGLGLGPRLLTCKPRSLFLVADWPMTWHDHTLLHNIKVLFRVPLALH